MRNRNTPFPATALVATLGFCLASGLFGCAQQPAVPDNAAVKNGPAPAAAAAPSPFLPSAAAAPTPGTAAAVAGAASAAAQRAAQAAGLSGGAATAALPPGMPAGGPPPFATVIKDARRIDGPITLWQKDDKVWIELLPAQFGKPYLLSPKIKSGISDAWVLGGLMALPINGAGGQQVVEFVRVHNQVRLQARNTDVLARAGTPEARAVADSYSNSLLGSVPVASAPHPDRKSVLVEANPLFLSDMLGIGMMLQRGLRQGYGLDRSNSVITAVRGSELATTIETQNHFYTGNIATGNPGVMGMLSNAPAPTIPRFLPDARSMLVSLNFSLAPLPEVPMPPRLADPRIGAFSTMVLDFSDDLPLTPRQRFVTRWRLEKKDPAAALSEPVKPITFWIDRNVPLPYRETVRAGILEWNRAFEKLGYSNAIRVEQQPDDAKFDTLDFGYTSVRWMMNANPVFGAIGPSHIDPRTGEILDADIAFEGMSARSVRGVRTQVLGGQAAALASGASGGVAAFSATGSTGASAGTGADAPFAFASPFDLVNGMAPTSKDALDTLRCMHGALAAEQLGYALDVMEARGELEPDSPMAQQFVLDYIKESIMHEVGHVLGLRHNFRASRAYSEAQLSDAEFTRAHGTTGSVMEYNAVNLPRPGKPGGVPFQTVLGPYDFWAVEYLYKPIAVPAGSTTPAAEKPELQRIAARSSEPLLAYGTDEDSYFGLDPETIQLDLGSDPIAFAAKRLAIARDLFKRQESRTLSPDRDYAVLRRSLGYALGDVARAVGVLARQVGGVRTLRDFPGSGRDPLQPVAAKVQREALDLIARAVLAADGLTLSPGLQRRLAPDYLDREAVGGPTDFAVGQRLLDLQRAVLGYFMSDGLAARVLDSAGKLDKPEQAFPLSELYRRLSDDVWSELGRGGSASAGIASIAPARRELQRDYINRVAATLLRPSPSARADARGLARQNARTLLARLDFAQGRLPAAAKPGKPGRHGSADIDNSRAAETRMHLADSADTLRQALAAVIQRQSL